MLNFIGYTGGLLVLFIICNAANGKPSSNFLSAITVKSCGRSIEPFSYPDRIVGGDFARPGQFPWLVSLREKGEHEFEHVCGATILNENWIITAAHCIYYSSNPGMYDILAGLHKLSEKNGPTVKRYKISKIVIHRHFNDENFHNDLALLQTTRPIDISGSKGYINGICLPTNKNDPTGFATVSGWGHTVQDGENSDTLKHVLVPVIPRDMCNEAYDEDLNDGVDDIIETMICAGMTGRDSCQNDSGGPLIQTDKNGVSTLLGVVSNGAGCGLRFFPGIYTKISMYNDWIISEIS